MPHLIPGLYGNLSLNRTLYHYKNLDTNALFALGRSEKRENVRNTINASLTYRANSQLSIILSYSKAANRSTLPLGRLYVTVPTVPFPVPATPQGGILGNFDTQSISVMGRLRF